MRVFTTLFLFISLSRYLSAQEAKIEIKGVVTYQTAQNIYAKFLSARGIKTGDKIYIRKNGLLVPLLTVENVSSVSCVGKAAGSEKIQTGDKVIALISKEDAFVEQEVQKTQVNSQVVDSAANGNRASVSLSPVRKERIDGRIQISSYSNFSSLPSGNNNRLRYTWSMNASNIGNSKVSFDSYVTFAHELNNWAPIRENIFNGLKIYDLNLKFEAGEQSTIWLGRKINPKISNLGAIDGVQFEMNFKHFYWGTVAGFRPDYTDYSFNNHLFEYGAFLGHLSKNCNGIMQTSLAGFNQSNAGKTDRRFAYFQHDNSLLKNLNLFLSSEVDLYKVVNGVPVNELTLTSLYLMLNYRISKKLSLSTSYDNRKNIIYYETYKNYIDLMLADATRQGVQIRINYRPINYMSIGVSSSYWNRVGDSKPTTNINGYLTYASLPVLMVTTSLTVNSLHTSYVDGNIYGLRLDKDFLKGKLNCGTSYRFVNYTYLASQDKLLEHIAAMDVSWQFARRLSISVNYEGTFDKGNAFHQIYGTLIKRF